ncbi:MAG: glycosyltransferase [Oscillospiraceae bacterium]|nr:glycosyltransferase [Oscillospiraceae bacterium]
MNILVDGQTLESPEVNRGIGVYFKNVLNNMVKISFIHNWFITLSDASAIRHLDPWVQQRLKVITDKAFVPSADVALTDNFTSAMEKTVRENRIDFFWSPNPLMVNVLFVNKKLPCRMGITVFDLIPAIMPIKEWSEPIRKGYRQRLEYMKDEDTILFSISEATQKDFEQYVCKRENIVSIPLAADSKKFYRPRTRCGDKREPIIVFTGGFDYRKNIDGAVEAFSKARKKYPDSELLENAKMYIVCNAPDEQQKTFYSKTDKLGLKGRVELTGFISDEDLCALYNSCDVFFFPSLYEGFGLPILEAMLGGAFILSADNSSLPEVCGGHAILCNANDSNEMADKLKKALEASFAETAEDKQARQQYALGFSWEKTAEETLKHIETSCGKKGSVQKEKIAIVTPWPEQQTGIGNFEYKLMPYLQKYFDIDIFVDNTVVSDCDFLPYDGSLYFIDELDKRAKDYRHILYQIGNSSDFHTGIYKAMLKHKGIAEIHDYVIHPFFYHSFFLKKDYDAYKKALADGYGDAGLAHYKDVREKIAYPDSDKFPMSESVSNISKATIFHNHWCCSQINNENVYMLPLSAFDKVEISDEEKEKNLLKLKKMINYRGEFIIGCFGFVNSNKRPMVSVEAVRRLNEAGYRTKLVFFGKCDNEEVISCIKDNALDDIVYITGYLDKSEYETYMEFCDIVVNLRYPSMGEASGPLCEAFKRGKPVIVSEVNQYCEFPNEVCWKVPVNRNEADCLVEMLKCLIDNDEVRNALGENAKQYADTVLSPEVIARQYYELISSID